MLTIIALPDNFVGQISSTTEGVISDLSPYLTLVLGVILAVVVVEFLIGAIRHR
jgi:hypothetical protein